MLVIREGGGGAGGDGGGGEVVRRRRTRSRTTHLKLKGLNWCLIVELQ